MDFPRDILGPTEMNLNRQHLSIPKIFAKMIRALDDPRCFVTIGDRRLLIFPLQAWYDYEERLDSYRKPQYRKQIYRHKLFGAPPTELDTSGRIKLSALHYSFLNEPKSVTVVGVSDHLEIYTNEEYDRKKIETFSDPEAFTAEEDMDYVELPHTSPAE